MTNKLTPREEQVCALVEKGYHNKAIAAELFLTEPTTKLYTSRIYAKLDISPKQNARVFLALRGPLQRIAELELLLGNGDRTAAFDTLKLALRRADELEALFKSGIALLEETQSSGDAEELKEEVLCV